MRFQTEYEILTSLNSDKILEIAFDFNKNRIKLYFAQKSEYEFLTLICENAEHTFVKNYAIYFKNGVAHINRFWGKYYDYARDLQNPTNHSSTHFYNKLAESIRSVVNPSNEFKVSFLTDPEGRKRISKATLQSIFPEEPIYFHHIRRKPISNTQFEKVSELLGEDVARYLKHSNLTAVFTADITKQKSFILALPKSND